MHTILPRRLLQLIVFVLIPLCLSACKQPLERIPLAHPAFDAQTLTQMRQTYVSNLEETLGEKQLLQPNSTYLTRNPFVPTMPMTLDACQQDPNCAYALSRFWMSPPKFPANDAVYQWWINRNLTPDSAQVCGLRFDDETQTGYTLKTFSSLAALQAETGFHVTHFQACGTCSTLQDLAVYGELDLTRMGKICSKRSTLAEKVACMKDIGFTQPCAESWAYNAVKTGQSCAAICIATYGLIPLLKGTENKPPVGPDGQLNACLLCDEMMSGPGFQFAAGRTRRNSGIISEIDRPQEQVYSVPHDYFSTQQ